jgi:hypothetical protein
MAESPFSPKKSGKEILVNDCWTDHKAALDAHNGFLEERIAKPFFRIREFRTEPAGGRP